MWRNIASNALTLGIVVALVLAGLLDWGRRVYAEPGPLVQAICLRIERGATLLQVSRDLEAAGALRDARVFRLGAQYSGKSDELRFGSYLIPAGASMAGIVEAVTRGGQSTCGTEVVFRIGVSAAEVILRELEPATARYREVVRFDPGAGPAPADYAEALAAGDTRLRVTLAEGVTSWQVVEALRAAEFLAGEVTEVPPEGSLAPDSYEVRRGAERAALLAEMAVRQADLLAGLWAGRAGDVPVETPEQALILASIIEKETGKPEERGRIASVFANRLRIGMRLQSDPTVIYGITGGRAVLGRGLRQSELRAETPYNTYVIDGLPATPIANPGRASIAAALDPEATALLYFVADGNGGHVFAETLEEHNRNVARWREIEAGRGNP